MTLRLPDPPWYQQWFGSDYLQLYQHRSPQEAAQTISWLLSELLLEPPCLVLDLACGFGRHTLELRRRGFQAIGFDLSWPLLRLAGKSDRFQILPRSRGDMRHLPFRSAAFGLILSLFTSFGYLESHDQDSQVLNECARVLLPDGDFVLDFLNAARVRRSIIPQEEIQLGGLKVTIRRRLDETAARIQKQIIIHDGDRLREYVESVNLYSELELMHMLNSVGIRVQRKFGDYHGAEHAEDSERLILIGKKSA
jgi:SAM-dependent methyltransferase